MRWLFTALFLLISTPTSADTINVNGQVRTFTVYPKPNPTAIWLVYHGTLGSAAQMANMSQFHVGGSAVVVYPRGSIFALIGWSWDVAPGSKDVAFTRALINHLRSIYGNLPVYAAGFSAGASMVWRVSLEADIDCSVAVAGALTRYAETVVTNAPYLLAIHGSDDPSVPLEGGTTAYGVTFPPTADSIAFVNANGGTAELRVIEANTHWWDLGVGYPTTAEAKAFCGG